MGQLIPIDPRDSPAHVESCSSYKIGGGEGAGDVQSDGICLPGSQLMEPCSPGMAEHLPMGNGELIIILLCFRMQLLLHLLNCLYLNLWVYVTFIL